MSASSWWRASRELTRSTQTFWRGGPFGLPAWYQSCINLGFLETVATSILRSLSCRILASSFPLAYLSNPFINVLVQLCILLDASSACDTAWAVARTHKVAPTHATGCRVSEACQIGGTTYRLLPGQGRVNHLHCAAGDVLRHTAVFLHGAPDEGRGRQEHQRGEGLQPEVALWHHCLLGARGVTRNHGGRPGLSCGLEQRGRSNRF